MFEASNEDLAKYSDKWHNTFLKEQKEAATELDDQQKVLKEAKEQLHQTVMNEMNQGLWTSI